MVSKSVVGCGNSTLVAHNIGSIFLTCTKYHAMLKLLLVSQMKQCNYLLRI